MKLILLLIFFFLTITGFTQKIFLPKHLSTNDSSLHKAMPTIAKQVIQFYIERDRNEYFQNLFRYQIVAGEYKSALASLDSVGYYNSETEKTGRVVGIQFRIFALTKEAQKQLSKPFNILYTDSLTALYNRLPEMAKPNVAAYFGSEPEPLRTSLDNMLQRYANKDSLTIGEARSLVRAYNGWNVYRQIMPIGKPFLATEDAKKYTIRDSVLITMRDGSNLSAVIVRRRLLTTPQPVVIMYNIYAGGSDMAYAKEMADHGFVGIVLNTRGKKLSPQEIEPFEHDGSDAYDAIDWISKQTWCNGKVGMYGGSYLGFSQWSAVKKIHPALKTIVPQVAVGIGIDYPMHNNVFMSYMLQWIHFVSNNKLTDYTDFNDQPKWDSLNIKWYQSGRSFRALDTIDKQPNKIFQRWLNHPSYDAYWQAMVPYGKEFGDINIPILTTTGYFDDDQRGAFYYLMQHHQWNKAANHYVLIGPWDHGGAQSKASPEVNGYKIDSVANININETVLQWFNYILKDSAMPARLKDKINYEVCGANEWRSAPSLQAMSNDSIKFYLTNVKIKDGYKLVTKAPLVKASIAQEVSYIDRSDTKSFGYRVVDSLLHPGERLLFFSEPLASDVIMNGSFEGLIKVKLNKKDIDLRAALYELQSNGQYFNLSLYLGRASYAKDKTKRQLLQPGKETTIPINNSYFISRLLKKGSRIVFIIGMNKRPSTQINYGSGKDVSDETIADGAVPLQIEWFNNSYIKLPVLKEKK